MGVRRSRAPSYPADRRQPNPRGNANLSHYLLRRLHRERRAAPLRGCAAAQRLPARARPRRAAGVPLRTQSRGAAVGRHSRSTPNDLSSLLLLDVEAGVCERASRIEEAITAVQSFVRRARLGLEPGWTVSYGVCAAVGPPLHELQGLGSVQVPRAVQGELDRLGSAQGSAEGRSRSASSNRSCGGRP